MSRIYSLGIEISGRVQHGNGVVKLGQLNAAVVNVRRKIC